MGRLVEVLALYADFEFGALPSARGRQHQQPGVGQRRGQPFGCEQAADHEGCKRDSQGSAARGSQAVIGARHPDTQKK